MSLIDFIKKMIKFKKSKFDHIKIYWDGSFGLKDGHLFKNKEETLQFLRKLNKALENRQRQTEN